MTITFRGGVVFGRREELIKRKVGGWDRELVTDKILFDPNRQDPLKDSVVITVENRSHTTIGEEIRSDSTCRKFGIGWYK